MSDATAERLQALQGELTAILEERLTELNGALRDTESATRRIIGAEIEIERHRAAREDLDGQLSRIQAELDADREAADAVRARHAALTEERDAGRQELAALQADVRDVEAEVARTRAEVADLEDEAEQLRNENASLRTKLKTLEENITRMQRIKDELMSSISGLTAQMSNLAGGSPE